MAEYLFDPEEAGVKLDTVGNPTSTGWKIVTPEMWKFRWSVADKIQVADPDFYSDSDWYIDVTKNLIMIDLRKTNPDISLADLAAQSLEQYLEEEKIVIRPYDMLIGLPFSDEHGIVWDALSYPWMNLARARELTTGHIKAWKNGERVDCTDKDFDELEALSNDYNMALRVKTEMTDEEFRLYYNLDEKMERVVQPGRYFEPMGTTGLRANPDHDWYLRIGFRGLIDQKKEKLAEYEESLKSASGEDAEELKDLIDNANASIRSCEAVIKWIKRHATEARAKIAEMPDERAKEILTQVADNCDWVAENPPKTFWQSMQMYWFAFLVDYCIETTSHTLTFLPDRVFYEWYERDVLKNKTLSRVEAGEILACYFAKWHEMSGITSRFGGLEKAGQGTRDWSVLTIGGQKTDGTDATNDLTMLYLDMIDGYRFHFPDVKFRWCTKTPKTKFRRLMEVIRSGMGHPSIRNDEVAIPSMMDMYAPEITLEEARNWAVVGCNSPGTTTNSKGAPKRDAFYPNVLKAVEFAMFNGNDPEEGYEWVHSIDTGDASKFQDFEQFYQAWLKQWEWVVSTEVRLRNKCVRKWEDTCRRPFLSLLYKGCMETGKDIVQYKDAPWLSFQSIYGWVDSIDSLAAVKYCVFEKKQYTMAQLIEACKNNWEGYEDMRKAFKNAPKFGNDNDFADDIMKRATADVYHIGQHLADVRGKPVFLNSLPISWTWMAAPLVGALPNGRKRDEAICDGGINPHAEFDKSGPWARLRSAMKIDQSKFKAYIYNQKFDYPSVEGEAGLTKLVDYTWAGLMGGMSQMQYNFLSRDLLREAQKEPEKHQMLSVRVSGYSAYFVPLPKFMQEAVIDRVDHEL
ncbi:MAG: hypothetical protein J7L16_10885 [Deltaproteobacteria bacterium]|nr:hypothetical protein [Deltaproteobacteria bacterium]